MRRLRATGGTAFDNDSRQLFAQAKANLLDHHKALHRWWCQKYRVPRNPDHPLWLAQSLHDVEVEWYEDQMVAWLEDNAETKLKDVSFGDLWPEHDLSTFGGILTQVEKQYPHLSLHDAVEIARNQLRRQLGLNSGDQADG